MTTRCRQLHCLQWLLLFAAVIGLGRVAEATCGDHLSHGNHARFERPGLTSPSVLFGSPSKPISVPQCQGPNCRRHDPIPTAPVDAVTLSAPMEATLTPLVAINSSASFILLRNIQIATISGPIGRVFRPPRMA